MPPASSSHRRQEAGAAVSPAQMPKATVKDRPARSAVARAGEAERGAPPARQHEMAGQWRPVPAQQPDRFLLDQTGLEVEQQVAHARRVWQAANSKAASCSTSLMTRKPSVGCISRSWR